MESVVVLLNEIVGLHKTMKPGERPGRAAVSAMFQRYQEERKPRMQAAFDASALITRMQAYDGGLMHFIMRYIFPVQGQATYADELADLCSGAPKFSFLPAVYNKKATFQWKDEPRYITAQKGKKTTWSRAVDTVLVQIASLLSLLVLTWSFVPAQFDHAGSSTLGLIMGA